ncbi:MAG: D-amino acid aminotransferase [Gammaproteobacteria bacterium]
MPEPSPTVYLNGKFLPLDQAFVSVLDRGFIFGDGVYEVIPVYGGHLFRLSEHLQRLDRSLAGIRLVNPLTHAQWQTLLTDLINHNAGTVSADQSIYLHITRGVAKRDFGLPQDLTPTVFAMVNPMGPLPASVREVGVAAITLDDIRWQYCHIKAITLLASNILRQQALDKGAVEAILIRNGEATEGAASNLFIVKDNTIITPPTGPKLLPGITRDLILELAIANNIACKEDIIMEPDLRGADEVWLTSSTKEILPVTKLDDIDVGTGKPGPMWARMIALYQDYKRSLRAETAGYIHKQ